jgi:hypothetical protein
METLIEYNRAQTIYFPLITSGGTDFQTTWTPATGETQYSIDGAAFGNTSNNPSHEGNGIWSLALTAAETSGTRIVITVIDAGADCEDQAVVCNTILSGQINATKGIITGAVDNADFTPTTTALEGTRTSPNTTEETTADHYNGRLILFTSGALLGQMSDITDYELANSKEKFTYSALTEAPATTDTYVIL